MVLILLTSEKFVKNATSISDNMAGNYLLPAIQEAQEINLKSILGTTLLNRLKQLVQDKGFRGDYGPEVGEDYGNDFSLNANGPYEHYRTLIDKAQYFLAYTAVVEVMSKVTFKIGNAGVAKTSDENVQIATPQEVDKMREYYQSKADFYSLEIQNYLLNNKESFPELYEGDYNRIHSNLYSAASCGLWLGGPRG